MELKPGYRQTDLGVFPDDWAIWPLGRLFAFRNGINADKDCYGHGVPFINVLEPITYSHIRGPEITGRVTLPESAITSYLVVRGDVLFNRTSETQEEIGLAAAYVGSERVVFGGFVIRGRPIDHFLDADYLGYALRAPRIRSQIVPMGQGAIRANISQSNLKLVLAPVPPGAEQRAIAAVLNDMDALLSGLDRLIAKKRDLKQAAMQQLLTAKTRLGDFRGKWEVKRLGEIAALNRVNVVPALQPTKLFTHFSLPAFDAGMNAQIELGSSIGSNKFAVPGSSVLVSKLNPRIPRIWAPASIPENAIASTEWLVLTPRDGVDRRYLFTLCSAQAFWQQMELAATGTTGSHQRISPSTALNIQSNCAIDPHEQAAIAAVLFDMATDLAALGARRDKIRALKEAMMQELLSGRTRLV